MSNLKNHPRLETTLIILLALSWICTVKAARADQRVTYRLKWIQNMSTAGDLVADQQGHFKAEGLTVAIKPGGPERDAIRELELGYADFGVASADQVVRAMDRGSPVVVVSQLFQVNPLQWIYRQDRFAINRPDDLRGKTIGVTFGKNDELILRTLLDMAQIQSSQVRLYGVRMDYTPFYKGLVDLWPVYINTQGVEIGARLRASGEPVGFLNPAEFGVRFVANAVVTTQSIMDARPELVQRFVRALLKGWREAMDPANKDLAIAAVQRFDRDTALEVLEQQLDATRKIVQPLPGVRIGAIDTLGWRQTESIMLVHHQISGPVHVQARLKPIVVE
jgi:NitT/TauT family transport system substrate-binding protein